MNSMNKFFYLYQLVEPQIGLIFIIASVVCFKRAIVIALSRETLIVTVYEEKQIID